MLSHSLSFVVLLLSLPYIAAGFYGSGDKVIELEESNFSSKVIKNNDIWLVEFYAPWCGHCQSLTPEWKKAAEALDGIIKVGAVDADTHKSLGGTYGVQGFPTIKLFGLDKSNPSSAVTYQGERTAKAIVKYALSEAGKIADQRLNGGKKSSSSSGKKSSGSTGGSNAGGGASGQMIELTPQNFDKTVLESDELWLVEFYAPWCGHCKNLAPEWKKAAAGLSGIANVAAVDADQHKELGARYGVKGFPTIKVFGKNKKSPEDYNGGRTAADIIQYGKNAAKSMPPPKPKVVDELVSQAGLDECTSSTVCVIGVLPHIVDSKAKGRKAYLDTLAKASAAFRGQPYHFVWMEAGAQPDLEKALGIGGFGYPAMAAYIKKGAKPQYTLLTGAFSADSISSFLSSRTSPHDVPNGTLPAVVKTTPWDGKDVKSTDDGELDAHQAAQEAADEDPELAALLKDL